MQATSYVLGLRRNYLVWHSYDDYEASGHLEGKTSLVVSCALPTLPTHSQITKIFKIETKNSEPIGILYTAQVLALHSTIFTEQISGKLHGDAFLTSICSCCGSIWWGNLHMTGCLKTYLRRGLWGRRSGGQARTATTSSSLCFQVWNSERSLKCSCKKSPLLNRKGIMCESSGMAL